MYVEDLMSSVLSIDDSRTFLILADSIHYITCFTYHAYITLHIMVVYSHAITEDSVWMIFLGNYKKPQSVFCASSFSLELWKKKLIVIKFSYTMLWTLDLDEVWKAKCNRIISVQWKFHSNVSWFFACLCHFALLYIYQVLFPNQYCTMLWKSQSWWSLWGMQNVKILKSEMKWNECHT